MIEKFLFGNRALTDAKAALDASSLRQRVVASNIANVNTPGYRPQEVRFEELLRESTESGGARPASPTLTHPAHIAPPETSSTLADVAFRDSETVDVEEEMIELQKNAMHYRALAQFVANRYRGLMQAINSQG